MNEHHFHFCEYLFAHSLANTGNSLPFKCLLIWAGDTSVLPSGSLSSSVVGMVQVLGLGVLGRKHRGSRAPRAGAQESCQGGRGSSEVGLKSWGQL